MFVDVNAAAAAEGPMLAILPFCIPTDCRFSVFKVCYINTLLCAVL